MIKRIVFLIGLFLISYSQLFAQDDELFGFNFTYSGKGKTQLQDEISVQKYELYFNLPVETKQKDTYLMHGLELGSSNVKFGNSIAKEFKVNRFHKLSYLFSIMKPIKNDWYLTAGVGPYVYSNFDSGLKTRELSGTGYLMFSKLLGKRKQYELTLGMIYHPSLGFNSPLPLVGVNWKPNKLWNISFGFPDFSIEYNIFESTTIGTNLFVNGDQFTLSEDEKIFEVGQIHLSSKVSDTEKFKVNKFSYTEYGIGFHIKQRIIKKFQFIINSGYSFDRKFELKKGTKKLIDVKPKDKYFIQAGISFLM